MNLTHVSARLAQSGYISSENQITLEDLKGILHKKFETTDFAQAKQDVKPFIKNPSALDVWSTDFFCQITDGLTEDKKGKL